MKNLRWVTQYQVNRRYYLGPVASELTANQGKAHRYLLAHALPEMGRLSNLIQETINLSVLVQLRSILLHAIPGKQELIITEMDSGYGILFSIGAIAKVLLSQLDEADISEVLHKVNLTELSGKIITAGTCCWPS